MAFLNPLEWGIHLTQVATRCCGRAKASTKKRIPRLLLWRGVGLRSASDSRSCRPKAATAMNSRVGRLGGHSHDARNLTFLFRSREATTHRVYLNEVDTPLPWNWLRFLPAGRLVRRASTCPGWARDDLPLFGDHTGPHRGSRYTEPPPCWPLGWRDTVQLERGDQVRHKPLEELRKGASALQIDLPHQPSLVAEISACAKCSNGIVDLDPKLVT